MMFEKRILCIGAGYVGRPTLAMIAYKCPQCKVTVVDINPTRIAQWNSDNLPIYEPDLDEIVKSISGRTLFFSTGTEKETKESQIIFVSVNAPLRCSAHARAWPLICNIGKNGQANTKVF